MSGDVELTASLRKAVRRLFGQTGLPVTDDCADCGVRQVKTGCDSCSTGEFATVEPDRVIEVQPALQAVEPGDTVLDLGSDNGADAMVAARLVGNEGSVLAYDPEGDDPLEDRLAMARVGIANLKFAEGTGLPLPVKDETFDLVTGNISLGLKGDRANILMEAARVLKPGGRFSSMEIVAAGPVPSSLKSAHPVIKSVADRQTWTNQLTGAGFGEVEIITLREGPEVAAAWLDDDLAAQGLTLAWIKAVKQS